MICCWISLKGSAVGLEKISTTNCKDSVICIRALSPSILSEAYFKDVTSTCAEAKTGFWYFLVCLCAMLPMVVSILEGTYPMVANLPVIKWYFEVLPQFGFTFLDQGLDSIRNQFTKKAWQTACQKVKIKKIKKLEDIRSKTYVPPFQMGVSSFVRIFVMIFFQLNWVPVWSDTHAQPLLRRWFSLPLSLVKTGLRQTDQLPSALLREAGFSGIPR